MQSDDRGDVLEGRDEILKSVKRRFEGELREEEGKIRKKVKTTGEPKLIWDEG